MWEGQERRKDTAGGIDVLAVHNTAMEALTTIKFHMNECDKRQTRIEKSQEEVKSQIYGVETKVSASTAALHGKIESGNKEIDRKINSINYKLALIIGGLLLLREIAVSLISGHSARPPEYQTQFISPPQVQQQPMQQQINPAQNYNTPH